MIEVCNDPDCYKCGNTLKQQICVRRSIFKATITKYLEKSGITKDGALYWECWVDSHMLMLDRWHKYYKSESEALQTTLKILEDEYLKFLRLITSGRGYV